MHWGRGLVLFLGPPHICTYVHQAAPVQGSLLVDFYKSLPWSCKLSGCEKLAHSGDSACTSLWGGISIPPNPVEWEQDEQGPRCALTWAPCAWRGLATASRPTALLLFTHGHRGSQTANRLSLHHCLSHGTEQVEVVRGQYCRTPYLFVFLCKMKAFSSKAAPSAHNWVCRHEPTRCPPTCSGGQAAPSCPLISSWEMLPWTVWGRPPHLPMSHLGPLSHPF